MAYGSSQARGPIGAVAAGYSHSNAGSELHLWVTPQLMATPWAGPGILNPLSKAMKQTHIHGILVKFVTAEPPQELQKFFQ